MKQVIQFPKTHRLNAAMVLALGLAVSGSAFAAGMPGAGTVTLGSATVTDGTAAATNAKGLTTITGLSNGAKITVSKPTVIQWGGPGAPTDKTNAGGFNVLAGNTLTFASKTNAEPVLNVDASGNTSVIAGNIQATGVSSLFIANANGITVTPGATISAPVVGLIGANFATTSTTGSNATGGSLIAPTSGPQISFTSGAAINVAFGTGGNINAAGSINGGVNTPATILIAGSGSVNVDATSFNYSGAGSLNVFGGVGFTVTSAGAATPVFGNKTSGVSSHYAYAPTNVTLNNAAPTTVFANGNLTFSGYSTLPSSKTSDPTFGWSGALENTAGSTLFTPSTIDGSGANSYVNPWFTTKNTTGSGYIQTPVGSISNAGLLQTVTTGLTSNSNGFTNTGTLRIGTGANSVLTVGSSVGDINLGGTVQGSTSQSSISSASLSTTKSGNITVSAPLTISGNSNTGTGSFTANAKNGDVSISGAMSVTDNNPAGSAGTSDYSVTGNNINISANQTVVNSNGTTNDQPEADLTLNATAPGYVTIGSGSTLTAGDVKVSGANAVNVNLVEDGNITATNTTEPTAANGGVADSQGRFTFTGNNMTGSGAGTITAQVFDLSVMGNVRKSQANLSNNFWNNGLVLTSAGSNPTLNLYTDGGAPQMLNLRVNGNITANASAASAPTFTGPSLSGNKGAAAANPNILSHLMLMATGNMTLGGNGAAGNGILGTTPGAQGGYFYFPGLVYFSTIQSLSNPNAIGSGSITAMGSVNNSMAVPVGGGYGMYFMTNNLTLNGSLYTNMRSWVNFANQSELDGAAARTYAVQYATAYNNGLNMAPPAQAIGNIYTIPTTFPSN